jgi:hypothetical protein
MSLLHFRPAVVLTTMAIAAAAGFTSQASANTVSSVTLSPPPIFCLLDAPNCGLTLPPDSNPHPTGGGRHPGGTGGDGGVTGGNQDTYCAEQRAALGESAKTIFGMQLLASIGC